MTTEKDPEITTCTECGHDIRTWDCQERPCRDDQEGRVCTDRECPLGGGEDAYEEEAQARWDAMSEEDKNRAIRGW